MKKTFLGLFIVLGVIGIFSLSIKPNQAFGQCSANTIQRAGCCSHHGGVCGCNQTYGRYQCCDGSISPSCTC